MWYSSWEIQLLTEIHAVHVINQVGWIPILAVLPAHARGTILMSDHPTTIPRVQAVVRAVQRVTKRENQYLEIPFNLHSHHWRWRRGGEGKKEGALSHALRTMLVVSGLNFRRAIEGSFKSWNQMKGIIPATHLAVQYWKCAHNIVCEGTHAGYWYISLYLYTPTR